MIKDTKDPPLYYFADVTGPGDVICEEYKGKKKSLKSEQTAIVIDNGSYQCRVGWANQDRPQFVFRNASTKARGKKDEVDLLCVGNDIHSFEAARSNLKTPFDQNVVTNFYCQEHVLDYSFYHLGLGEESHIGHPIVVTEPVCNPNYSRSMMSELLFECYNIPSLAYGVDALFSLYYNGTKFSDVDINYGIVVSCGYQATHILPIVDGCLSASRSRRITIGGSHLVGFMHRLIQLKLPSLHHQVYLSRAQELVVSHCYTSLNYGEELVGWAEGRREADVRRVQLPYYQSSASLEATADPLKEARDAERRRKAGERLRELNRKKKQEKVVPCVSM
jgi:actin-related protein 5